MALLALLSQSFPLAGTRLSVTDVEVVVRGEPLGVTLDGLIRPDGSVCVVDYSYSRVSCFTSAGKLLWHAGSKGEGPGEFQVPYRIAAAPSGELLVYDIVNRSISRFTASGRFMDRHQLGLGVAQVTSLLVPNDSTVLVSGYAPGPGSAGRSGIHRFTRNFVHTGSFAPLPLARDPSALAHYGAGALTQWGDDLVYLRKIPYEIFLTDSRGQVRARYPIPAKVSQSVDQAMSIRKDGSNMSIAASHLPFISPGVARPLGRDMMLVARVEVVDGKATAQWWDVISTGGRLLGSTRIPQSLATASFLGVAPGGDCLWFTGEDEGGEPTLLRMRLTTDSTPHLHPIRPPPA